MTNSSIFTRVFALALCVLMFAGILTACFQNTESNPEISTQSPTNSTVGTTTTGGQVENEPNEDPTPVDPNQIFSGSTTLANDALIYGTLANDVFIGGEEGVAAIIPADVKVEAGASSLSLSVKKVEDENLADALSNLDVHISGVALDNLVPMTVKLGAILPTGLSQTEFKFYHIENDTPVLMTRVNSVTDFAIHNQYVYDEETGDVTIYVASFSMFVATQSEADTWDGTVAEGFASGDGTEENPYIIETAEQLAYFAKAVDEGNTFEGKYIKLGADLDLYLEQKDENGEVITEDGNPVLVSFNPIGYGYWYEKNVVEGKDQNTVFMGTFDGGNHTIYNLYENCWELDPDKENYSTYTYSTAGAGLFASIKNATIKNLAVSGAEIVFECVDMGVVVGYAQGTCHFENIIVTDSKIANYNRYTGGVVGEVSYGPYGIDTSLGYSHTFKNITVDSSVTVSGLWGSFGCGMGGVIGGKWGDATVYMENVVSAPTMDVYNDVVSAYQWYAFRGCGMLIGHTEEPYSDGRHSGNATASFLTCENVNVYYGDWVDYNYYKFADQDSATGRSYPWVRAEAGEYCDAFSNIRYGVPTHNGVKVSDLTEEELKAVATDYTTITFNQLYGADRGMYGTNEHDGVTVHNKLTKTIYIQNNLGWENLKLYYWFINGDEIWTTVADGVTLTEENGVYKVDLPAYAHGYQIIADGENATREFYLSEVEENGTYTLDFEHAHNFIPNRCDCGAVKQELEHQFTLGEDGEEKHSDGSGASEYTETIDNYTLTLSDISNVYHNARDAKGNSCIKLGTSSAVGKFSFTVPENIDKVIIYVAGREAKDAKVSVNGVEYEITTHSDDGEYTAITVDTSETKTVSFTTVSLNGEERCMINTISFVTTRIVEVHECDENEEIPAVAPTCTETGLTSGKKCSVCGKVMVEQETVSATGHTEEAIPAVDTTCTKNGLTEGTRCSVCEEILVEQTTVPATGHNYVEGTCANCGEAFPTTSGTTTYIFSNYTEGTQYAEGEKHELDANVAIITYKCHFTDELRIYSSNENNGYVIVHSLNPITKIDVNAGNKVDKINIYGSDDGINWTTDPVATISVTSTSYNDYEASLNGEYKYLKLDVAGSNQIRIKSMTLTTVPDCAHASTTEKVVAPTCTEAGRTDTVCSSCGKVMSTVAGEAATGHSYNSEVTTEAKCTTAGVTTYTCTACDDSYTEEIEATGHNYVNGTCTGCGETESAEPTHECEHKCATCGGCTDATCKEDACANKCKGHEPTWTLVTDVNNLQVGDQIIIVAKDYNYALSTTQNTNNRGQIAITKDGNTLKIVDGVQIITLEAGKSSGTFAFNVGNGYLYAASSGSNHLKTQTTNNANGSWKITIAADGTATIVAQGTNTRNTMQYNQSSSLFACYASASQKAIVIYKLSAGSSSEGGGTPETPACQHTNTTTNTVNATCTTAGSITVTCTDCGKTVSTETIESTGHNYVDGTCSVCGAEDPNAGGSTTTQTVTETMNIYANKGTTGTNTISWTSGNITVTNNKASSSTAIRTSDSDHFRIYAKSQVVITANGNITKVVITCTSSSYATAMKTSATNAGYTATVSGSVVTITVNNEESITITATEQIRINKVEVTYTSN